MKISRKVLIIYIVMQLLTVGCASRYPTNYEAASWHADQVINRNNAFLKQMNGGR